MDKDTLTKKEKNRKTNKVLLPIILVMLIVFFILKMLPNNEGMPDQSTAQKISRKFITKTLIDPKSAKFIDENMNYTAYQDSTYVIKGVVKATNKMGLNAPSEYIIVMKWYGGSHSDVNQWRVIKLELE